jgi:hypothetical protein
VSAIDVLPWKDYLTMTAAMIGAALGIMNTWNTMSQRRVRVRVIPQFLTNVDGTPIGFSIEVINRSAFAVTLAEVGFRTAEGKKIPLLAATFSDNGHLPRRLEAREAASAMFGPKDFGAPSVKLRAAYARTACGRTIHGNSPAGRQFSKMIAEIAEGRA